MQHTNALPAPFLILAGVFALAFASQLSIPLQPVPLTFQSATVILIGMAYGERYGAYVVSLYLLAGFCGAPVLADYASGPAHFAGPTAGYLFGFLPAAWAGGWLARQGLGRNIVTAFIAALTGAAIIFAAGVTVLTGFIGFKEAITFGLMPFIISEPIKLLAVSAIIPRLWKKSS
jgi:biotin transport system substrate-specific component